jgi:hypothetical protein
MIECIETCVGPENPLRYPRVMGEEWANYRFATSD